MQKSCRRLVYGTVLWGAALALAPGYLGAVDALTLEQKEGFLRTAKIVKTYSVPKGITATVRVTLSDGTTTHDASVQKVNEAKNFFQPDTGLPETNFKDSYAFNIAAWKLAKLLGLDDMLPPSVDRRHDGQPAAFTWWI